MSRVPRGITIASLLMGATAVAALAMTVATLIAWRHFGPASELYRKFATGTPDDIDAAIANVRGPLVFGGSSSLLTVVLFGRMALAARVPKRPWVRPTVWVAAIGCVFLLLVDLNGGLNDYSDAGSGTAGSVEALIGEGLTPGWYPNLNATLGVLTLVLVVVATVAVSRSSLLDYYRKESWQKDDRWTGFVSRQNDERE